MNAPRFHPAQRCRAFTLPELIIGLLLLALVGGATAAVASSVTRGWMMGEANQISSLTITRTMLRLQDKMQRARFLGQCDRGGISSSGVTPAAAILFWREDDNGDGTMQLDETQMLTYDATELVIWEVVFPNAVTRTAQNGPFPTSMLTGSTAINTYKTLPYAKKYTITRNVRAAAFDVITPTSTSLRPTFEFRLKFDGTRGETVEYGTATQRMVTPTAS